MQITKEFLKAEIAELELELQKAVNFQIQVQATITAYRMLLNRLDAPEMEQQTGDGADNGAN